MTRTDQDRINAFSRLNSRADEIVDVLDGLTKQKEDLEEVETEMELLDDDDDEQVMQVSHPSFTYSLLRSVSPGHTHSNRCRPLVDGRCADTCVPLHRYKIDTTFVHLPASQALEQISAALEKIRTEVTQLEDEKRECEDKMDELKKELYAKFGSESPVPLLSGRTGSKRLEVEAARGVHPTSEAVRDGCYRFLDDLRLPH